MEAESTAIRSLSFLVEYEPLDGVADTRFLRVFAERLINPSKTIRKT